MDKYLFVVERPLPYYGGVSTGFYGGTRGIVDTTVEILEFCRYKRALDPWYHLLLQGQNQRCYPVTILTPKVERLTDTLTGFGRRQ